MQVSSEHFAALESFFPISSPLVPGSEAVRRARPWPRASPLPWQRPEMDGGGDPRSRAGRPRARGPFVRAGPPFLHPPPPPPPPPQTPGVRPRWRPFRAWGIAFQDS